MPEFTDKFSPDDFTGIAEQIVSEFDSRKNRRSDMEKMWAEVDRQLRMEPETSHKLGANGQVDPDRKWLPETELPLQAQTLEMLMADNRRLKFPRNRDWFRARAALTEDYIERFQKGESIFPGEKEAGTRAVLSQDNADRLAQSVLTHCHSQYDFRAHIDRIDAQAYAYGFGVGRLRLVNKRIMGHNLRGRPLKAKVPMYIPRDAKKVYLDDSQHAVMHEGEVIGPNIIQIRHVKLADLQATAETDDSYIPSQIRGLKANKDGEVCLIELEGDLVYERSQGTIVARDVVLTVAKGENAGLVRQQEGIGFSTYNVHDYHIESPADRYGTSPLIKGMPVAKIAAQVMNRLIESGQLKNSPPIGYSRDDLAFAGTGGPVIHPYAQWPTTDAINVYDEVGGDPSVFFNIFSGLIQLYTDVTGVNPPRLGAQTKSHTTAFAKDVEITQGSIRTVDYVNSSLEGPMTRLLQLEYKMAFENWKKQIVFVEAWDEFVDLEKNHLPDIVRFKAIGAGAPAEDQAKQAEQLQAVQTALQVDSIAIQLGREPKMDHGAIIDKILQDAGFSDITEITNDAQPTQPPGNGQLPGILTGEVEPL